MPTIDPITGKGSTSPGEVDEFANTYNTWNIDTTNLETYAWAPTPETSTTPTDTPTTTPTSGTDESISVSTESRTDTVTNPYDLDRNEVLNKKYDVWSKYADLVSSFDKWDIVDKMRLKTWWVADLDSAIENLKVDQNKSRPALMERYANVIDPRKREALISAEESNISKQINDLSAVRQFRVWAIKDMANAEISRWEQKLKGLEAQFNLYSSVLWDIDKADKIQSDMEKTALEIQKKQLDMKWLEEKYWVTFQPGKTSFWTTDFTALQEKYPNNASFKNNNPGNIKYNENWANTLKQYWIEITKWTEATDGGNFARYNSVEDALQGRNILLFNTATYPNMTVEDAMRRYSNNGYWAEVTWVAGNKLMKDLSSSERASLVTGQLKWEDQAMYKELIASWIDPTKVITEWSYKKTGLSETEKKNQVEWPFEISTVEEFNQKSTEIWTPAKFKEKITIDTANSILDDNINKWQLSTADEKRLKDIASPQTLTKYNAEKWKHTSWQLLERFKSADKPADVVKLARQLQAKKVDTTLIWEMLQKSGALDRSDVDEGYIWDDKAFDDLEDILWERPGDSDYFNLG